MTLDGATVLSFSLSLPMSGAWSADVQVAASDAPVAGARASLQLPGADAWSGLVKRSGVFGDRVQVRLIGGHLDWQATVEARNYRNVSLETVLYDLGVETDQSVSTQVQFWTRSSGSIGQSVQQVADYLGLNWRINPDGTVRLRAESPTAVSADHVEIERIESRGLIVVAPENAVIVPGCLLGSDSVGDVVYDDAEDGLRCRYYTDSRGRIRQALERLVRWVTRDALYLGTYSAQVVRQAADGTLDLMPHDERIRSNGFQAVPIRHGLPGVSEVQVVPGETVLLGFDNGSPDKPYAAVFYSGSALKLAFQVLSFEVGGVLPVAMAQLVDAALAAHLTAFNTHTHAVAAAPGVSATPLPLMVTSPPTASTVLKSA